ncbi:hypothetical protein AXA84_0199 [Candidatus Phytoplasma oryzae]|uniref:Uncharacterized protein n=1 Tax=Candidatus Phytoplasma oryzae TaxID=203274 RepID=A0A139JQQ3_9MOLU|nr:hypothetical protein [Candidatus Phytoplasma oryzae]KXT29305.1 hypothetical protein AXA84_0199 [Candidatus Phytoplasma oryzae]
MKNLIKKKSLFLLITILTLLWIILFFYFTNNNYFFSKKNNQQKVEKQHEFKKIQKDDELEKVIKDDQTEIYSENKISDSLTIDDLIRKTIILAENMKDSVDELNKMIQQEEAISEVKQKAINFLKNHNFTDFQKQLLNICEKLIDNKISEDEKIVYFDRIKYLEYKFNFEFKTKISDLIQNLFKRKIKQEEFNNRINYILNLLPFEKQEINLDTITSKEYEWAEKRL